MPGGYSQSWAPQSVPAHKCEVSSGTNAPAYFGGKVGDEEEKGFIKLRPGVAVL